MKGNREEIVIKTKTGSVGKKKIIAINKNLIELKNSKARKTIKTNCQNNETDSQDDCPTTSNNVDKENYSAEIKAAIANEEEANYMEPVKEHEITD